MNGGDMFGFLKAKTPGHPLDGGDPWKGRLAFAAIVLVWIAFALLGQAVYAWFGRDCRAR